jgi:Ca2+-binding RTX toxin-like protein
VRRLKLVPMLAMVVAMTLVAALPALADVIRCDGGDCEGTNDPDTIFESEVDDFISALGGDDDILANDPNDERDRDEVRGQGGADIINVDDGDNRDFVNCGEGRDVVRADDGDDIANNCERVR